MGTLYIEPTDEIQVIVDTSQPRDTLIFNPGNYDIDTPIVLKSNRHYIARGAIFTVTDDFNGSVFTIPSETLEEERQHKQTYLQRAIAWILGIFGISRPRTFISGFVVRGNGQNAGIQFATNDKH